jgi:tellurite methyltransferase
MSEQDKEKWDTRYRAGAYADRKHASDYMKVALEQIGPVPESANALDLACGAGRNALYLASKGYEVDAVDVSGVALQRAQQSALASGTQGITWIEHDLDNPLPGQYGDYDLIIIMRYLDLGLLESMATRLSLGGYLVSEVHLQTNEAVAGPQNADFRAAPGELLAAVSGLEVVDYFEGLVSDPGGETVAVARVLALSS